MRSPQRAAGAVSLFLITTFSLWGPFGALGGVAQAAPTPLPVPITQQLTAGWVARQLDASGGNIINSSTGQTDYTRVANAVWSLAGAGVARNQIQTAVGFLESAGEAYIGPASDAAKQWARIATVALTLAIAGQDPTAYPTGAGATRDLTAELRGGIAADGTPGPDATGYNGALAVLALARTREGAPANLVAWLKAQPCADPASANHGAFGFTGAGSCDSGDTDSTALAIQGLLAGGVPASDPVLAAAGSYLEANQDPSGGWGIPGLTPANVNANSTGLVVQALRALGSPKVDAGEKFLLSLTVGCDRADPADPTRPAALGAMVYDAAGLASLDPANPSPEAQRAALEASVQGLLGLGAAPLGDLSAATATTDVPNGAVCLTDSPTIPAGENAVIPISEPLQPGRSPAGWWIGGGVAVVLLAGGLAGIVLGRRHLKI